jgi:hypothetical protein
MRHSSTVAVLFIVLGGILSVGCEDGVPPNPAAAQQTYGAAVDPTDALPVPAVTAERSLYRGRRVTLDGRIAGMKQNGCTLQLASDGGPPPRIEAARSDDGTCAWHVDSDVEGFAVASGTLRAVGDTLRLAASGVQITPLRPNE